MSDCTCCTGIAVVAPGTIENPQGLSTIPYRVGIHGQFFASMLAENNTSGLRTRETDDFTVAVMDAAAVLCDVLSFYQESFANEHYLRTSKERQSLVGMGQLLGYQLAAGRAASTYLAFTLESPVVPPAPAIAGLPPGPYPTPGAVEGVPASVSIPIGTKVQSVPGPGESPQTFETVEALTAQPEWNSIPLRPTAPFSAAATAFSAVTLQGFVGNIKPGDFVLLHQDPSAPIVQQVLKVDTQTVAGQTTLTLDGATNPGATLGSLQPPPVSNPPDDFTESYILSAVRGRKWNQPEFEAIISNRRWDTARLQQAIRNAQAKDTSGVTVSVMSSAAALFGHNADLSGSSSLETLAELSISKKLVKSVVTHTSSDGHLSQQNAGAGQLYLDVPNPAAVPGRWIMLDAPSLRVVTQISGAIDLSVDVFGPAARTTRVTLKNPPAQNVLDSFSLRSTRVFLEAATFAVAAPSMTATSGNADAGGDTLRLDGPYLGLVAGRDIVVMGELTPLPGQTAFEQRTIAGVTLEDGYTVLKLSNPLTNRFAWSSVRVLANVAASTHGESLPAETLGAGDATKVFQRFALKQGPLTWVSASVPAGILPAITVRVNGVAWTRVDNLFACRPQDRVYMLQTTSEGTTWVCFGDGVNGARLPSGAENITADYRRGIGEGGNLKAGQLSLALSRPLGLSSVVNPVAATGGGAPETLEESRISMPYPIKTLGRIVTLPDYEDFARASAGIAKAQAAWVWDGHRRVAMVTIAGPNGAVIPPGTPAYSDLLSAIQSAGDERVASALTAYRPVFFDVDASIIVDPAYVSDSVLTAVKAALQSAFSFTVRAFGQPVYLSEVIAVMQSVAGVIAVDVNALYRSGTTPDLTLAPADFLAAAGASALGSTMTGAELLTLRVGALNSVRGNA
ncbi:hypothetical protein Terro_2519 [Terriglobus roseus DSM 18391]|uniref:Uncharacterized protein n=1 Tax=Terriglobus roseus (strain DSM 18391 / NRRL B-41598 / KBS 63) TaxID=926566 RepID=I3ZHP7_TERRK|nr:putative baseplate assembly protein [Terriglobus roseus]AFL88424.1 hypothetical protein Terro_2155 [Terriglobus roseus DSM 18391]AFL88765.1 hypothetical protein Terro_2519 [Terriglobus roseus DSM 18391]